MQKTTNRVLSDANWSSLHILAHRFYAIVPMMAILVLLRDPTAFMIAQHIQPILIVTGFGVLLPLLFLQIGIQQTRPTFVMLTLCFVPVFSFFFQLFDSRISVSLVTFTGILIILTFSLYSVYQEHK